MDDPQARIDALERENSELRAKLAELESAPLAVTVGQRRRARVATIMVVGGAIAGLAGVFGNSLFVIACGIGWMVGGAAVGSSIPRASDD